jgi:Tol biopolymer transport system component/tRNA A-37 threonylcarbamoyl transferase component Bud32
VTIKPGQTLLHYRIVEKIGEGGMGEVWKAVDTTLDREVAIKLLPAAFAEDAERLARFEREAKLLASFNHPGIAGIYGLHESAGVRFLAMELVPGEDLSERLARGALPLDEALPAALQMSSALEFAHEHGVIHRDLKPANVKLTPDGQVKVLDFGLAKAAPETEPSSGDPSLSPTLTSEGTRAGTILGTAGYMSPEQARGKPVDRRADIWAFGCVLFETLTGSRGFPGETISDTLVSVLSREPAWSELPSSTPPGVRRLLERCLNKDAQRRLRDIGEARIALEDALAGEAAEEPELVTAASRSAWMFVVAAVAGVALFAAGYFLRPSGASDDVALNPEARVRRLTYSTGLEQEPSISPDGNYVAYTTDDAGNLDIAVLPLAGGNVNRVVDHPADDAQPRWSPDGSKLAFISTRDRGGMLTPVGGLGALSPYVQGTGGDLFLMPAMGGTATKLVEQAVYPTWSPGGDHLAFQSNRDGFWKIWRVPATGGEPVALTDAAVMDLQPAWSPEGDWIAISTFGNEGTGLYLIPAGGGDRVRLFDGQVASPAWSDDGRFVYFSSDRSAAPGRMNLWRVEVGPDGGPAAEPQRVTLGEGSDIDTSISRGGHGLVFSEVQFAPDAWMLEPDTGKLEQLTTADSSEDYPHVSPDGRRLVFQSDRGETEQIWTLDLEDGSLVQVSAAGRSSFPRWSPDGTRLTYYDLGGERLVVQRWGEAAASVIATDPAVGKGAPQWSPDGERLVAHGDDGIWVHTIGGTSERLTEGFDSFATWSPDGREIAFQREPEPGLRDIWVIPAAGGEARRVTGGDAEYSHPQWCPTDPDRILVVVDHKYLALVSVRSGEVRRISELASATVVVDYPAWSFDGRRVYFSLARRTGDVFLVEGL